MEAVEQTIRRTEHVHARLAELEAGVRVELDGALGHVLDMAFEAGVDDSQRLQERATEALDVWLRKAQADLRVLVQDVDAEFDRQMSRPVWRDLLADLNSLADGTEQGGVSDSAAGPETAAERVRPRLLELNKSAAKSLKEVREVLAKRTSDYSVRAATKAPVSPSSPASKAASSLGRAEGAITAGEVLVALGPTIVDIYGLVSEHRREQEQKEAQRASLAAIERKIGELRSTLAQAALGAIAQDIDAARAAVEEAAEPVRALDAALQEQIAVLAQALEEAEELSVLLTGQRLSDVDH